jgi:hypothetical protein
MLPAPHLKVHYDGQRLPTMLNGLISFKTAGSTIDYLETIVDKLNELPFRCGDAIILPFLFLEGQKLFVIICCDAKGINSL